MRHGSALVSNCVVVMVGGGALFYPVVITHPHGITTIATIGRLGFLAQPRSYTIWRTMVGTEEDDYFLSNVIWKVVRARCEEEESIG